SHDPQLHAHLPQGAKPGAGDRPDQATAVRATALSPVSCHVSAPADQPSPAPPVTKYTALSATADLGAFDSAPPDGGAAGGSGDRAGARPLGGGVRPQRIYDRTSRLHITARLGIASDCDLGLFHAPLRRHPPPALGRGTRVRAGGNLSGRLDDCRRQRTVERAFVARSLASGALIHERPECTAAYRPNRHARQRPYRRTRL